ncbi:MAG: hypothetical protein LBR21_06185, partial [Propionibacteriaceae bacterium]|nr:hypothetical protein [Propionibacteriaceae bacterium]
AEGDYTYYSLAQGHYSEAEGGFIVERFVFKLNSRAEVAERYMLASSGYPSTRPLVVADGEVYQLQIDGADTNVIRLAGQP